MVRKSLLAVLVVFIGSVFMSCGGDGGSNVTADYDAVVGEGVILADVLDPAAAENREVLIDEKWGEIDQIYEQMATLNIPSGYTVDEVCDNRVVVSQLLGVIEGPALIQACAELDVVFNELDTLQDVVNFAADYLWESNNTEVALVNGSGLALITNEGVATVTVRDANGNHVRDIVINASRVVHKVRQLQIQNEKFVVIEEGMLRSFNADGSTRAEADIAIDSYDDSSGELVLSGSGALLVTPGQLVTIAPVDPLFPDGGLRKIVSLSGGGPVTCSTSEGSLSEAIQALDMDHKESVNEPDAEQSGEGTDGEPTIVPMAAAVQSLAPTEFQQFLIDNPPAEQDMIYRAAVSGDWNPDFAFTFDYTDSQDNEPEGSGSMRVHGVIGFKMPIHVYLRYSDWKLQRFKTSFKPTQYASIYVEVNGDSADANPLGDADIRRTLAEVRGKSIKFFIGSLPVYMRPIFEVAVNGRAVGHNVEVRVVDYEVWCQYGVSYLRGRSGSDWRPIAHYNRSFKNPGLVDGDYSLSAWAEVQPTLRFYGLGGPYALARIGTVLKADTSKTDPGENWKTLESFVKVNTGVAFDVTVSAGPFDYTVIDYEKDFGRILNLRREEWNSGGPYVP